MALAIFVGAVAGIFLLVAIGSVLNGWALSILWGWFMVPFGLPPLNIPTAIGLALVVAFLTHQVDHYEDKEKTAGERFANGVLAVFLKAPLALLVGWIVKHFL